MAAAHFSGSLRGYDALFDLRGADSRMNQVIDRPRIAAETSRVPGAGAVLTPDALDLVAELHERFDSRRRQLPDRRLDRQKEFDAGGLPDFREDTRDIREADWTVGSIPADLQDRRRPGNGATPYQNVRD